MTAIVFKKLFAAFGFFNQKERKMNTSITVVSVKPESDPVVSVIIPVYNTSAYLAQCLESVIGQTYRNLDIIVIDDGSTDGSGIMCDRYADSDPRIRVFHMDNKGISASRNFGIEKAAGRYLAFVDSDDWMERNAIQILIEAAERFDADIVTAYCFDEYVGRTSAVQTNLEEERGVSGQDVLPLFASGDLKHVVWNKLFRAECLSGHRFPEGCIYEDVATTWKIMKELAGSGGVVATVPQCLFHYRVRKSSVSHSSSFRNLADSWAAYRGKFEGLYEYREYLYPECIGQIAKMWKNYTGFNREERKLARPIVREMRDFSRENYCFVRNGNYPKSIKRAFAVTRFSSPAVMFSYRLAGKILHLVKKRGRDYYD